LIAFDNMLWGGAVAKAAGDADTRALQALNDNCTPTARRHGAAHGGRRTDAGAQALSRPTPRFPCALRPAVLAFLLMRRRLQPAAGR
jgi:hypothetical protein